MRLIATLVLAIGLASCTSTGLIVNVPSQQTVEIDYPGYEMYEVKLKNTSSNDVQVKVLNEDTDELMSGFGLGGSTQMTVGKNGKLALRNINDSPVKVKIKVEGMEAPRSQPDNRNSISFTLVNSSSKSIPLLIPSVMNPNLSPFSKSGVDLNVGQEILFRAKGKRYVLLTVDNNIEEGAEINVGKLLKQRKSELGID